MTRYSKLYATSAVAYIAVMGAGYFFTPNTACYADSNKSTTNQQKETTKMSAYGHIDAKTLKNLIDTRTSMKILDARNEKWDDGRRIPGAKSLPFDSSPEEMQQMVPNKDDLVVVYCGAYVCPLGKQLVESMLDQGYTHVLEYAGGIKEWADNFQNPIDVE